MAVSLREAGQADFSLRAIALGTQVDLYLAMMRSFGYVLESALQHFYQDIVTAALSPGPADPNFLGLQPGHNECKDE